MTEQDEYTERPVPEQARLGFLKPAVAWVGFAYAYVSLLIGSEIVGGLGAPLGYAAIIAGQAFLFTYSGLIAHRASKLGLNFSMMCRSAFGNYGYTIPVLLIGGLVTGWFAFQAWLAADLMVGLYGGESFNSGTGSGLLTGIFGTTGIWAGIFAVVFGLFAVYGIRALVWMGRFVVISITVLVGWMIYSTLNVIAPETGGSWASSLPIAEPWTFALGFSASAGTFIVSATMTGDFTRWTRNPKQAWGVTAAAFPGANLLMLVAGGLFTAVTGRFDFYFGLAVVAAGVPITLVQWASNISANCMYSATQSFRNILYYVSGKRLTLSWKKMAFCVIIAGTAVASANLITSIVSWLHVLGAFVPLVGGILIGHFWIVARNSTPEELLAAGNKKVNGPAVAGFSFGLLTAIAIQIAVPEIPAIIGGLIGGIGVYPLIAKMLGYSKKGRLTQKSLGTSVVNERSATLQPEAQDSHPEPTSGDRIVD